MSDQRFRYFASQRVSCCDHHTSQGTAPAPIILHKGSAVATTSGGHHQWQPPHDLVDQTLPTEMETDSDMSSLTNGEFQHTFELVDDPSAVGSGDPSPPPPRPLPPVPPPPKSSPTSAVAGSAVWDAVARVMKEHDVQIIVGDFNMSLTTPKENRAGTPVSASRRHTIMMDLLRLPQFHAQQNHTPLVQPMDAQ